MIGSNEKIINFKETQEIMRENFDRNYVISQLAGLLNQIIEQKEEINTRMENVA